MKRLNVTLPMFLYLQFQLKMVMVTAQMMGTILVMTVVDVMTVMRMMMMMMMMMMMTTTKMIMMMMMMMVIMRVGEVISLITMKKMT